MLTYNPNIKPKRKDRPWLLVLLVLIWVFGTVFFHSPWEPYEPIVFAVVKGIINNNSWFIPIVSGVAYFDIQPFYFWLYAIPIKIFGIHNIEYIANTIRIINTLIIFSTIVVAARIGSGLSAYKNGRSVVLILISCVGFINNSYLLSPNILILLGFSLYIYALQIHSKLPGVAAGILSFGLILISINFTEQFVSIALLSFLLLPIFSKVWRTKRYLFSVFIGVALFFISFMFYVYQLQQANYNFFLAWQHRYTNIINWHGSMFLSPAWFYVQLLFWYVAPAWILAVWSFYRRKLSLFKDPTLQLCTLLSVILFASACLSGEQSEILIFPIIIPLVLIASVEIDSIRISIVALFNWFSMFLFASLGICIWLGYLAFIFNYPPKLVTFLYGISQNFTYNFNIWQLLLALLISAIWLFMVTRKHIRGREMVTNWASGSSFVIVLFMALGLPWLDSVLSFKPLVQQSLKYINPKDCVATNTQGSSTHSALWYYYADVNLLPSFIGLNNTLCNQAVLAVDDIHNFDHTQWKILWQGKRPIDKRIYLVVKHR